MLDICPENGRPVRLYEGPDSHTPTTLSCVLFPGFSLYLFFPILISHLFHLYNTSIYFFSSMCDRGCPAATSRLPKRRILQQNPAYRRHTIHTGSSLATTRCLLFIMFFFTLMVTRATATEVSFTNCIPLSAVESGVYFTPTYVDAKYHPIPDLGVGSLTFLIEGNMSTALVDLNPDTHKYGMCFCLIVSFR